MRHKPMQAAQFPRTDAEVDAENVKVAQEVMQGSERLKSAWSYPDIVASKFQFSMDGGCTILWQCPAEDFDAMIGCLLVGDERELA